MGRRQKKSQRQGPVGLDPQDRSSESRKRRDVNRVTVCIVCGLLLLVVFAVFGQTVAFDFVNFDDDDYVSDNPDLTGGLSAQGITWALTTTRSCNWHPVTWFSYLLDYQLYGLKPWGYHLTNVLLHAATAIALLMVLWRMTGDFWPSAIVAAVFAVHPLRVESVAWISERKDVLSGLFFMLTLGAYLGYVRRPFSVVRYLGVVVLFVLGLMAKPMLVTLPFVLLLLDYWPLGRMALGWRLVVEKVPLLALSVVSCAVTSWAQGMAIVQLDLVPLSTRIANALVSCATYLWQLFCPTGLAVFYPPQPRGLPPLHVLGALLLLVCICVGVLVWRRRSPNLFVGWFWYVGMLVPVIGVVQVGGQLMADRYTYLPQIGLLIALAWAVQRALESRPRYVEACAIAAGLAIAVLMGSARQQTSYWRNSETLWNHAIDCTEYNAIAHNNLGMALAAGRRFDEAIVHYKKALEIKPWYAMAHCNLGRALTTRSQIDEAVAHFRKALEIMPDYVDAYNNLGNALERLGRCDEAIADYKKALELKPDYADAYNNLGNALAGCGRLDEAMACYQKAFELKPDFAEAHSNLGFALARRGRLDEAAAQCRKALEIKPDCADAYNNFGFALEKGGRFDEAIPKFNKALELNPDFAGAHNNLGAALVALGRLDEAIIQFQMVLKTKPDHSDARNNLAIVQSQREELRKMLAGRRESLRSRPDDLALLNDTAWMLATNPNASIRNGAEAVELAERAVQLSGGREPAVLGTLAAAYAEAGRFSEAVDMARKASERAAEQNNQSLAESIKAKISLYEARTPLREIARPSSSGSSKP
jgi:protein O-mannosyl-transferase